MSIFFRMHSLADAELFGVWNVYKFYCFIKVFLNYFFDFIQGYIEKFSACIYHIYLTIFKCPM